MHNHTRVRVIFLVCGLHFSHISSNVGRAWSNSNNQITGSSAAVCCYKFVGDHSNAVRRWHRYWNNIFNFAAQLLCQFHNRRQNIGLRYLTSLYVFLWNWVETIFSKKNKRTRDFTLLTQKSINHMRSGYFRFIKTAQSRTLNSVWSKGLDCLNIRWRASGFNGTRPRNNPIWHSHREGTGACKTDVKATDLAAQATLWAGPPHPSIAHCDWLIKIYYYCPVLWALSAAQEKITAATWGLRTSVAWRNHLIQNVGRSHTGYFLHNDNNHNHNL